MTKGEQEMSTVGHTPGPWYVTKNPTWMIRSKPGKCQVGKATEVYMCRAEREANARLIALAPELLEALSALMGADEKMQVGIGGNPIYVAAFVAKARSLISRAEGKS
jgi:hypothetical protein